jgi:hypothetical protein
LETYDPKFGAVMVCQRVPKLFLGKELEKMKERKWLYIPQ